MLFCDVLFTCTLPRYVAFPLLDAIDLDIILLLVFLPICIILAPVSCVWLVFAAAIVIQVPDELSPFNTTHGYFIVTLLPILPSIHSIEAFSSVIALFVTKLYTLFAQFCIVVYLHFAFFSTYISTTAACRDDDVYVGAVQPSI